MPACLKIHTPSNAPELIWQQMLQTKDPWD